MTTASPSNAPVNIANLVSKFTGEAADMYGVPLQIIEALVTPNSIVDMFPFEFNNQPVFPVEMLTSKHMSNPGDDGTFTEGGCPGETEHEQHRFAYSAKSWGACTDKLTYVALASKANPAVTRRTIVTPDQGKVVISDEFDMQMFRLLQQIRRIQEYHTLNGDSSVNPNNFNGMYQIMLAGQAEGGRLDLNGVRVPEALSVVKDIHCNAVTVDILYEMIGALEQNYVNPADITLVMRSGMANEIARLISLNYLDPGAKRQEILNAKTFPLYGYEIPWVTTQWISTTGSNATQEWCSDIHFWTFNYLGVPSLWYQFYDFSSVVLNTDLFAAPAGAGGLTPGPYVMIPMDHGDYCTSTQFCLWAHGRIVAAAPQSLGLLRNVKYNFYNERQVTQV